MKSEPVRLRRCLGLPLITLYGIGSILGAGIYVLVGEVVAVSGMQAPLSFLLAALIVAFSAFSYAELAARFPRSAGEAVYVLAAFARPWLFVLVGMAVILIGSLSAATITAGVTGYLDVFVDIPEQLSIVLLVLLLTAVAVVGVLESVAVASLVTIIEIAGLLLIVAVSLPAIDFGTLAWSDYLPPVSIPGWLAVSSGAFLAFFAYIGFEDMVNMAEEVREPSRTMPRAIIIALLVTSVLYLAVVFCVVSVLPLEVVSASDAPFVDIIQRHSELPVSLIGLISIIAIVNGGLIQLIMASRVLYGMAAQELAPAWLAVVNRHTRTPVYSTLAVAMLVLLLALWLPVPVLAAITSLLVLCIFALVNLALLKLKVSRPAQNAGLHVPLLVPLLGVLLSLLFLAVQLPAIIA